MRRRIIHTGVVSAVVVGACGALAVIAACSSSSSSDNGAVGGTSADGGTTPADGSSGACTPSSALQIQFSPMYSAFVTDSTTHQFQVPAIVTGASGAATWSASDSAAVTFTPDPTTGGTIMTVKKATPTVTITAQVGSKCTSAELNITPATEADWQAGNARYNNGVPLIPGCIDQNLIPVLADAGIMINLPGPPDSGCPDAGPACTACHGPNATGGFFQGIEHTPEQTAGFTDPELTDIFVNGVVRDGGPFDPRILPYEFWSAFHAWKDINTPAAQKGMVVYLRSLTPAVEEGGLDFGGVKDSGILGD